MKRQITIATKEEYLTSLHPDDLPVPLVISRDSNRFAYVSLCKGKAALVLDGLETGEYALYSLTWVESLELSDFFG